MFLLNVTFQTKHLKLLINDQNKNYCVLGEGVTKRHTTLMPIFRKIKR